MAATPFVPFAMYRHKAHLSFLFCFVFNFPLETVSGAGI